MKKTIVLGSTSGNLSAALHYIRPDIELVGRSKFDFIEPNFEYLKKNKPDNLIISAAYTNVDQAEEEKELAFKINAKTIKDIVSFANWEGVRLIYISTDYVFDGKKDSSYIESDNKNPLNYYGYSKAYGEDYVSDAEEYDIIRTSRLFSPYGNNFVKNMHNLLQTKEKISVVTDQVASFTYAKDLAMAILKLSNIDSNSQVWHFAGSEFISWYEMAAILKQKLALDTQIIPIAEKDFKTLAVRPQHSALNSNKFNNIGISADSIKNNIEDYIEKYKE